MADAVREDATTKPEERRGRRLRPPTNRRKLARGGPQFSIAKEGEWWSVLHIDPKLRAVAALPTLRMFASIDEALRYVRDAAGAHGPGKSRVSSIAEI